MKYRNTKTGVVVEITDKIKVGVWVPVEDQAPATLSVTKTATTKKKREVK